MEEAIKVGQGSPTCVDQINDGTVALVINTTHGKKSIEDSYTIRRTALNLNVPYQTTMAGAEAAATAIEESVKSELDVRALQSFFTTKVG